MELHPEDAVPRIGYKAALGHHDVIVHGSMIVHNERTNGRPKCFRGQREGFQTPVIFARLR
jgi:hypothetical protein